MTNAEIVANIMAVLTPALPYLKKAGESLASEVGKESLKKATILWGKIRDKFRSSGNPKGETTLDLFVDDPDTYEVALTKLLSRFIDENPDFAVQLKQDLADEQIQEIIVANKSIAEKVRLQLKGSGKQTLHVTDESYASEIDMMNNG